MLFVANKPVIQIGNARRWPRSAHKRTTSTLSAAAAPLNADLLAFTRWSIKEGIKYAGVRPEVRDGVRGVYSTLDVPSNAAVIAVPKRAAISAAPGERTPSPQLISQQLWDGIPWFGHLAVKLMDEAANPTSKFGDYLKVLPDAVDLPALWPLEELQELQYEPAMLKVQQEQQVWSAIYGNAKRYLGSRGITQERFEWALSVVRSRSFAGPHFRTPLRAVLPAAVALQTAVALLVLLGWEALGLPLWAVDLAAVALAVAWLAWDVQQARSQVEYVVCPFIDMLNHSCLSRSECSYDWLSDAYKVVSTQAYRPGQQILINYGSMSNDQLLLLYGFVEENNPEDRYAMERLARHLQQGPLAASVAADRLAAGFSSSGPLASMLQGVLLQPGGRGFPPEVSKALETFLALELQQPASHHSLQLLVAEALADACRRELEQMPSTLEQDLQGLQQLQLQLQQLLAPPPAQAPAPSQAAAAAEPAAAAEQEELVGETSGNGHHTQAAGGSGTLGSGLDDNAEGKQQTPAAVADEVAVQGGISSSSSSIDSSSSSSSDIDGGGSSSGGSLQDDGLFAADGGKEASTGVEEVGPGIPEFDVGAAERRQTILMFRIGKKKILVDCMSSLQNEMKMK